MGAKGIAGDRCVWLAWAGALFVSGGVCAGVGLGAGGAGWLVAGVGLAAGGMVSQMRARRCGPSKEIAQTNELLDLAGRVARIGGWRYEAGAAGPVWSAEVCRIHEVEEGYEPTLDEAIDFYAPEHREVMRDAVRRGMETGEEWDLELEIVTAKGNRRWVRAIGRYRKEEGAIWGTFQDIHARRSAEERLALAMRAGRIGTWDWHVPSGDTFFSETFYTMLGYEPGELPMCLETWKNLCHPDDLDSAMRDVEAHFAGRSLTYLNEHRLKKRDGSWTWIRDTGEVVEWSEDGSPKRMIGVHVDIHDQVVARERASALQEQLRLFVEHTPAAVAMFDRDVRYLVASKGWYEQYGIEEESIIGKSHYEVFPTIPERWKELHRRALYGEVLRDDRDSFVREDGSTTWVRWELLPWFDEGGSIGGIMMFTEVINERIEYERRLEDARSVAEEASSAKSNFLANMSHEIRTPMTAILGFADILENEVGESAVVGDAVGTIRRNGEHLLAIINDILDLSKIEAGKMQAEMIESSLVDVVEESVRMFAGRARTKGIALDVAFTTEVPVRVETDPTRLRQILVNLVGNAVKFTDEGGVRVEVGMDDSGEAGSLIRIAVADTGIGIERSQLEKLFGAFAQADSSTSRRFGGSGLGLRISKLLARMLGGDIAVESVAGEGSTFVLTVAANERAGEARVSAEACRRINAAARGEQRARVRGAAARALEGMRVLVAEDGPDNQRLLHFLLSGAGAEVKLVDTGLKAVEAIGAGSEFDLVLMDMQMPELDGYGAARRLRERGCGVAIVALTAHAMSGDRERCLASGCDDYLTKPIDREKLIEACVQWGRGGASGAAA